MNTVSQALVEHEPTQTPAPIVPVSESAAIFQIIERAARDPNVDIDKMQRLMEMHDKVQATRAKTAYAAAFAEMQPNLPEIPKHGKGHGSITYALWEDVNELIKPVLAAHGFGISFRCGRDGNGITVTAVLAHREGHSEETMMLLPIDTSGSKNPVQAVGSSTQYGKRYTAAALLNLTSRDEDDDGKAAGGDGPISDAQRDTLLALIAEVGADVVRFCAYFKIEGVADLPASQYERAVKSLEKKGKAA